MLPYRTPGLLAVLACLLVLPATVVAESEQPLTTPMTKPWWPPEKPPVSDIDEATWALVRDDPDVQEITQRLEDALMRLEHETTETQRAVHETIEQVKYELWMAHPELRQAPDEELKTRARQDPRVHKAAAKSADMAGHQNDALIPLEDELRAAVREAQARHKE